MTITKEREVVMGTTDPCRRFPRVRLAATSAVATSAVAGASLSETAGRAGPWPDWATRRRIPYPPQALAAPPGAAIASAEVAGHAAWPDCPSVECGASAGS